MKNRPLFSLACVALFLLGIAAPCLHARTSGVLLPDNFGYAVRIAVPLHEKAVVASGFYYHDEGSMYVVTARHVLFATTQVEIKDGVAFPVPRQLVHRIKYDKKVRLLSFEGVLSSKEKDEMLMHPSVNEDGRQAIQYLYEKSQKLKLKAHTATVVTCSPGTGELELGLTRMVIKGLIKYHPVQDVALIKIGRAAKCGENTCTDFVDEVRVNKPENVLTLDSAHVELMNDVVIGSEVFVFGNDSRQPLLRESSVAGKNKELGLIILHGAAHPGDSGGLAIKVDQAPGGKSFKGIGVMSSVFHYERDKQDSRNYSLAVAFDAVMELLKE
jgi:hypothetical protein